MNKKEIYEVVRATVAQAATLTADEVQPNSDLILDLNMDSLAVFEVVVDLETAFDLQISDEAVEKLHTPAEICDYIERQIS